MANLLTCGKCGNSIDSTFGGKCPWCVAAFALSGPPRQPVESAALIAGTRPSQRLGKYLLSEKLGAGGMGEVWKALDTELNRWVAVKFLRDEDPRELARFEREAHTAAILSHPNIAAVHEIGEAAGRHYIAMQYVQGRTLETFPKNDRTLLVRLCRDAARALDHAHRRGVIHRDVKPGNLMVEKTEEETRIMVLDFGLARPIEGGEKLSNTGSVVGTPQYLSPEQTRAEKLDERTDVYSLGATMYEVLTGRAPFEGRDILEVLRKVGNDDPVPPRRLDSRIHRDLETIILKCLEKDRTRRYETAGELAEDLDRYLDHEPVRARPASTIYRLRMKLGKRKAVVATGLSGVAGIVIVAALMLGSHDKLAEARAQAGIHLDLSRLKVDQIEQLMKVAEDRTAEIRVLSSAAEAELAAALRAFPDHEEAHVELGRLHALSGQTVKALESFTRAIQLAPRQAKAYLGRATLNLDIYEELRHDFQSGGALAESAESRAFLNRIHEDLRKVRLLSSELPQLRYADGMILFAEGKFAEAAGKLGEYLNLAPGDAVGWLWRGHALVHANLSEDAIQSLSRALALRPRLDTAFYFRGNAFREQGRLIEAIADYDATLRLNPKNAKAYNNRGNAKLAKGLHDEAIADYDEALRLDSKYVAALNNRGNARKDRGLYDEAIADYDAAILLDPTNPGTYSNRGLAKARKGLYDEAIADHDTALRMDPTYGMALNNRGLAWKSKGLYDEAIADFDAAISLNPKNALAFYNRGITKKAKGLQDAAIADLDAAIRLDPRDATTYVSRGDAKHTKGLHDDAIADFDAALRLDPKSATAHVSRGNTKFSQGHYDQAIADYDAALKLDPKSATYSNRGLAKARKGLFTEAIADYDAALNLDPGSALGYSNRAAAKAAKGLYDQAIADYDAVIKLDPTAAAAYNDRAGVKVVKGLFDDAITDLDAAVTLDPKFALAYLNRAVVKKFKERYDESFADCGKALEAAPKNWSYQEVVDRLLAELESLRNPKFREARDRFRESHRLHEESEYAGAIEGFRRIAAEFPKSELGINSAYNVACGYARLGEKRLALDWLEKAVEMGWRDVPHIEKDADLDSLRAEARYRKIVGSLK